MSADVPERAERSEHADGPGPADTRETAGMAGSADEPGGVGTAGGADTAGPRSESEDPTPRHRSATANSTVERFRVDCAVCGWLLSETPTGVFARDDAHRRAGAHEAERGPDHDCTVSRVPDGPAAEGSP